MRWCVAQAKRYVLELRARPGDALDVNDQCESAVRAYVPFVMAASRRHTSYHILDGTSGRLASNQDVVKHAHAAEDVSNTLGNHTGDFDFLQPGERVDTPAVARQQSSSKAMQTGTTPVPLFSVARAAVPGSGGKTG